MTDRELLERAAKAAGIEYTYHRGCGDSLSLAMKKEYGFRLYWNPLFDDGDALRLAVRLGMDVCFGANYVTVRGRAQMPLEGNADDPYSATRRAIVRAAAAIQQSKESSNAAE